MGWIEASEGICTQADSTTASTPRVSSRFTCSAGASGVLRADLQVVGDFQRQAVVDLDAFMLDVVHHQLVSGFM